MIDERIPVTIITGFLGSGKTTLLNRLISENEGLKIVVIENEFGEIDIDSDLVIGLDENIFQLSNGCICCSLQGELSETLHEIVTKVGKIDHLVIETTGVADPGPVALTFVTDYRIQDVFRLDAIVALVDTENIANQLVNTVEAGRQIGIADIIILNKTDRVSNAQCEETKALLTSINNTADLFESSFGALPGFNLLKANPFNSVNPVKFISPKVDPAKLTKVSLSRMVSDSAPVVQNPLPMALTSSVVHSDIKSHSIQFEAPLDLIKFDQWMSLTLAVQGNSIYRIKGILNFHQVPDKVVFQAVNSYFISSSGGKWPASEERLNKIVFIGKGLKGKELESGLRSCAFDPNKANIDSYYL